MTERFAFGSAVAGAMACIALTSCVQFESRPLEPELSAASLTARTLEDSTLLAFVAARSDANAMAEQSTSWDLQRLTLAALYFHPDLDVARAERAVADAGRITAGQRPGIGLGLTPGTNATTSTPSPRIVTLTANLSLETANKRNYRAAQAAQLAEAARLNIESVAWQVRSRVRRSMLDLYGAIESGMLLLRQLAIHTDNLRILQGQYDAGAISAFELTQARLAANATRVDLHDAQRREAEARAQLAQAIGVPVSALARTGFVFDAFSSEPVEPPVDALRQRAVVARADILQSLADYAASQSELQLEVARQYPDLQLGPGYEYDQGDNKWSLGLAVSLPAGKNRGAIAAAQARRETAAARFNALQAGILGQIDLAAAAFGAASTKLTDTAALMADTARQAQTAAGMLRAGAISRADVSALQLQLAATELSRLDALLELQQAAGLIEDAVQAPLGLPSSVWELNPRSTFAGSN